MSTENTSEEIKYHVYGDESISNNIITYALFACSPTIELEALKILEKIKTDITGRNDFPLHCRKLFHEHPRKKMGLDFLDKQMVCNLYCQLFTLLNQFKFKKLIIIADKLIFREKIILGDGVFPDLKINDKVLINFCAQLSLLPFFDVFKQINCIKFFPDVDNTKIDWLGKKSQAIYALSCYYSGENMKHCDVPKVIPQICKDKPRLLEIADAIAYISAKALSIESFDEKKWFQNLFELIQPYKTYFARHPSNGAYSANIGSSKYLKFYLES